VKDRLILEEDMKLRQDRANARNSNLVLDKAGTVATGWRSARCRIHCWMQADLSAL
jgi:hypothetical protein